MRKQFTILATSILAASANAAFEEGNAVFYAWDSADNDTYFVDLGAIDLSDGSGSFAGTDAGLASWLGSQTSVYWSIVQTVNDTTPVGGPPAPGQSLLNSGIVSTSTDGVALGFDGNTNEQQKDTLNAWLAQVQAASGGSTSFSVLGTDPEAAGGANNAYFFSSSMIAVDAWSDLYFSQANPADGATFADPNVVTLVAEAHLSADGYIRVAGPGWFYRPPPPPEIPIPATAWLFGSGLIALLAARRKS